VTSMNLSMGMIRTIMGITGLMVAGVFAVAFAWIFLRRGSGGMAIAGPVVVLRRFEIREAPADGVFVRIVGRVSGLIGWLLSALGFGNETQFEVTSERISFSASNLSGQMHILTPITHVANTACSYAKPLHLLVIGGFIALGGVLAGISGGASPLILGVLLGGVFFAMYWYSRKLSIRVISTGGQPITIVFKPSVLENVTIDMNRALQAIALLNRKVLESHGALDPVISRVTRQSMPVNTKPGPSTACGQCGAPLSFGEAFCTECGGRANSASA